MHGLLESPNGVFAASKMKSFSLCRKSMAEPGFQSEGGRLIFFILYYKFFALQYILNLYIEIIKA